MDVNMIGVYGPWAASLSGAGPTRWSFRQPRFDAGAIDAWRHSARAAAGVSMQPATGDIPRSELQHQLVHNGLHVEHLSWQLPYGPPTEAVLLKPAVQGRLPAVLALHDHGGNKYFGWRNIAQFDDQIHPLMKQHRDEYYGGLSWANELARRGFAVLVHDAFAFASRRVRVGDLPAVIRKDQKEVNPESEAEIKEYNRFASDHEHLMSKSLLSAGTTWPGVARPRTNVRSIIFVRDDIDPSKVGCAGLSGGGLRTVYLAGVDDRDRCACCVGMMTTWRDYLLNKCYTHTWMVYIPGIPLDLDYPETLGLPCRRRRWFKTTTKTSYSRSGRCKEPIRSSMMSTPRRPSRSL